jgi:hypothetical protein
LGEHAKLVPKKIKIGEKEIKLEEGDFLIQCVPDERLIFLVDFKGEFPGCLIRIFRVESFDKNNVTIWQTSEGICGHTSEGFRTKFWGYDGTLILEKIMEVISKKTAPDCIKNKENAYEVIKPKDFKTIVSTLSMETKGT